MCSGTLNETAQTGADVSVRTSGQSGNADFGSVYPEVQMQKPDTQPK